MQRQMKDETTFMLLVCFVALRLYSLERMLDKVSQSCFLYVPLKNLIHYLFQKEGYRCHSS